MASATIICPNCGAQNPASLFDAYALLQAELGKGACSALYDDVAAGP